MADATCLHTLRINENDQKDPGVTSVAISPDSRYVAAGSLDKIVRVWDVQTGHLLERLEGHKDSVYSVAFMPDGKTIVSGSLDKTLKLWQLGVSDGRGFAADRDRKNPCKQTLTGHKVSIFLSICQIAVSLDWEVRFSSYSIVGLCFVGRMYGRRQLGCLRFEGSCSPILGSTHW